jgi:XTP/dITP diphosphohydrolase
MSGPAERGLVQVLFATTNANKLREIRPLVAALPIDVVTLADLPPREAPDEPGRTFWENARHKALAYADATGLVVVAEDSGIEIAALGGGPGVHSARFLGTEVSYQDRFEEIYRRLAQSPRPNRNARFVTALAVVRAGDVLFETEAGMDGVIADRPRGTHGFGYDPIFYYPPLEKTTAELTMDEKSTVSHRARAFRDFARWASRRLADGARAWR